MYSVGVVCVDRYTRKSNVFLCKVDIYVYICMYIYTYTHHHSWFRRSSPDEFLKRRLLTGRFRCSKVIITCFLPSLSISLQRYAYTRDWYCSFYVREPNFRFVYGIVWFGLQFAISYVRSKSNVRNLDDRSESILRVLLVRHDDDDDDDNDDNDDILILILSYCLRKSTRRLEGQIEYGIRLTIMAHTHH